MLAIGLMVPMALVFIAALPSLIAPIPRSTTPMSGSPSQEGTGTPAGPDASPISRTRPISPYSSGGH